MYPIDVPSHASSPLRLRFLAWWFWGERAVCATWHKSGVPQSDLKPACVCVWAARTADATLVREGDRQPRLRGTRSRSAADSWTQGDTPCRMGGADVTPPVEWQGAARDVWWQEGVIVLVLFGAAVGAIIFAGLLLVWIMRQDEGSSEMKKIANDIRTASRTFLFCQYGWIGSLLVITAVIIWYVTSSLVIAASFLFGGCCSGISGIIALWSSVQANVRVTASAAKNNYDYALKIAFRAGVVGSMLIISLCLLGLVFMYSVLRLTGASVHGAPYMMAGFAFGGSFVALFAQLAGGIFTKGADIGADLVGKGEASLSEDDPRNPAVMVDLVGDNVGDCAGRGADLFESVAAENIGAMILGAAVARQVPGSPSSGVSYVLFPLVLHAAGLMCTVIGMWLVRAKRIDGIVDKPKFGEATILTADPEQTHKHLEDPMVPLRNAMGASFAVALIALWVCCALLLRLDAYPRAWLCFAACGTLGLFISQLFVMYAIFYTDYLFAPTRQVAQASASGAAITIIRGVSLGAESSIPCLISIGGGLLLSYLIGSFSGVPRYGGLFGTAMATVGLLMPSSMQLALDIYGPISDNAGGIAEMSSCSADVRAITDRLDSVGNTTKANTKGYAVGSAGLAAFLLFQAFRDSVNQNTTQRAFSSVNLANPMLFVSAMFGVCLVYAFSAYALRATVAAAEAVVKEIRRQFVESPGILEGTVPPDYSQCVKILVFYAIARGMVVPGLIAVLSPIVNGLLFRYIGTQLDKPLLGVQAAGALLLSGTTSGIVLALLFNNAGGAWDNAKKYIESGRLAEGGKNSEAHKAAVVGDLVGDAFKDVAGPSLHIVVKTLSTVTLVFAPLFLCPNA
ncbi:Pyrophosphate-energized membrane proton pump 2 [Porphyridium purpureum]|uniref:H(+)-exporting diphosphatase n=1 Tax=Porphyridium purpureum TaxID=35688 RepID=A0A5J4Z9A0_PORPP|nr:Pyrophosphate-energized membrane proton pump 2 [Porphyridium purpureum]|eukprot:POR5980..scf295_1